MKNRWWSSTSHLRRLWLMLALSLCFFVAQMIAAHVTHSLTLLSAAYQMLYNIFSLGGCIATIKMCQRAPKSLSNTFGWARLEVMSMVVNLLFLAALNFSLVVEALQTIVHADHGDVMHYPIPVCILTGVGLLINLVCIVLIGGYTHHQGSFLAVTPGGDVVITGTATEEAVRCGLRRLPRNITIADKEPSIPDLAVGMRAVQRWPHVSSIFRDIASSVLVLVTAAVVYVNGENTVSLVLDPAMSFVSVIVISITSYPFILQAGKILLQTTPAHIDVQELETKLQSKFPSVVNIHDLHVWALTPSRVYCTVHLLFMNETDYLIVKEPIQVFFANQGITHATIQPEIRQFAADLTPVPNKACTLSCSKDSCKSKGCCLNTETLQLDDESGKHHHHSHQHGCCPSSVLEIGDGDQSQSANNTDDKDSEGTKEELPLTHSTSNSSVSIPEMENLLTTPT